MKTLLAAMAIFALAILGMAVGVIFGNRRLKGTCGGLSGLQDDSGQPLCDSCSQVSECREYRDKVAK